MRIGGFIGLAEGRRKSWIEDGKMCIGDGEYSIVAAHIVLRVARPESQRNAHKKQIID
jgi:hypothetical protein